MVEGIFIDRKWNLTRPSDLLAMNLSVLRQAVGTQGLWHGAEREARGCPPTGVD